MTNYRQFTTGQKFFIVMAIFVSGLLIYANIDAFNVISAPLFFTDIIAYSAITIAVVLTIITLTVVISDIRRGLFSKAQTSNYEARSKDQIKYR